MKKYILLTIVLFLSMIISPVLALDINSFKIKNVSINLTSPNKNTAVVSNVAPASDEKVKVLAVASGNVIETTSKEYLIGCVASEMPASYNEEALKAQAVAAYTNLVRLKQKPDSSLNGADISDSPNKHQGYLDKNQLKEKWGDNFDKNYEKISSAVSEVLGEIICYDGAPIVAAYCSMSSGRTESAAVIWGEELPYLKSVVSSGDKLSPNFSSTVVFSPEQIKNLLSKDGEISLSDNESEWFKDIKYSENNTSVVVSVNVGGKEISGNKLREMLSLKSPAFKIKYENGNFNFEVYGYGHLVGMSQYGANYMAENGSNYKEILKHYYKGTKIERLE